MPLECDELSLVFPEDAIHLGISHIPELILLLVCCILLLAVVRDFWKWDLGGCGSATGRLRGTSLTVVDPEGHRQCIKNHAAGGLSEADQGDASGRNAHR
jgi:hypothetical protein